MKGKDVYSATVERYNQVTSELYKLQKTGIKFGLNTTKNILDRLGNPHKDLNFIHVGGTNGKGSVVAIISSILKEHGFKVGSYTSPHLVRFTERMRIDWEEIHPSRVVELYEKVKKVVIPGQEPTFFEFVTAMALCYFAEEEVDFGVIEVGLGGRLDSTNIITPQVSIITNVSFDHQEFLGKTLASIAREKAGIIKPGIPVVTAVKQPVAQSVIKTTAYEKKAPVKIYGKDFHIKKDSLNTFQYISPQRVLKGLSVALLGDHQRENTAVALCALEVLEEKGLIKISEDKIRKGLFNASWPGRAEIISRDPLIIIDGAHNPSGAESLKKLLKSNFSYEKLYLIVGVMADKDIKGIFRRLLPEAEAVIFTKPKYSRSADPETLKKIARPYTSKCYVIPDVKQAIEYAKTEAGPRDIICITGSLYFMGEVKEIFGERSDLIVSPYQ